MGGGIYILLMELPKTGRIRTGSLGTLEFPGGLYAYAGSAQGGLEKRIERHRRKGKKLFWHIDYLLEKAKILDIYAKEAPKSQECGTAKALARGFKPVPGFGCSDCRCKSHLFFLGNDISQDI